MQVKTITSREFQHNVSFYLQLAQTQPIEITKHGQSTALLIHPEQEYKPKKTAKKTKPKIDILNSPVRGMYKDREDWKGKSTIQIARELREKAWYGRK